MMCIVPLAVVVAREEMRLTEKDCRGIACFLL